METVMCSRRPAWKDTSGHRQRPLAISRALLWKNLVLKSRCQLKWAPGLIRATVCSRTEVAHMCDKVGTVISEKTASELIFTILGPSSD